MKLTVLINEFISKDLDEITGSFVLFNYSKTIIEMSSFNLIMINLFFIHGKFMIIRIWKMLIRKKLVNCGFWPKGTKNMYIKWIIGPEPIILPSKFCNGINRILKMERILCYCAYFLSTKISPITLVSNKMMGSSNNSLNWIVHRETKCLIFEISTEFVGIKKKVMVFANDWMQFFLLCCCRGNFDGKQNRRW